MELKFLWKTEDSGNGDCPSLFKTDGGYIAVGKILNSEDLDQVHAAGRANNSGIGADETAVFIPADVLDRLREIA